MQYAGFWKRFGALWIDSLVFLPFGLLLAWLSSLSRTAAILLLFPSALLAWTYNVYFHGRWGQTFGKMATRIRVVSTDGSPVGFRRALLRDSPAIALGICSTAFTISAILQMPASQYDSLGWFARQMKLAELMQSWRWLTWLQTAWFWSEVITMLFNVRRRALHDYLAGTVVVHTAPLPVAETAAAA